MAISEVLTARRSSVAERLRRTDFIGSMRRSLSHGMSYTSRGRRRLFRWRPVQISASQQATRAPQRSHRVSNNDNRPSRTFPREQGCAIRIRPQIEYWVRKHIIRGEFESGTGLPRQFVFRNLVEVSVAL